MDYNEQALKMHEELKGKFATQSKVEIADMDELSVAYTPGVAEPCRKIHKNKADSYKYTSRGNMVAIISDGTAVLGLGDIGPEAAMPVMEGKAILLKRFGGVDAVPICIDVTDTEDIIRVVKALAPTFGGINLEDIRSPKCFEIERRLEEALDIPVFHDDQHGTAIVTAAALINALKLVGKKLNEVKIVLNGPGAAGTAVIHMLLHLGAKHIVACDRTGILHEGREEGMTQQKVELAKITNPEKKTGSLADAVTGADVFIGVSTAGALTVDMAKTMNTNAIVFAMANPEPEISYGDAISAGVAVMGTGRSDNPNQINNVLAFPGIFRGALDAGARDINSAMKAAAVYAIAELIPEGELRPDYIIPNVFDPRVAPAVAKRVAQAARDSGVCIR